MILRKCTYFCVLHPLTAKCTHTGVYHISLYSQIKKTDESLSFLFGEYYQERFEAAKKGSGGAFLSGDRRIFQSSAKQKMLTLYFTFTNFR